MLKKLGLADNVNVDTAEAALVGAFVGDALDQKAAAGDAFVAALSALEPEKLREAGSDEPEKRTSLVDYVRKNAAGVLEKLLTGDQLRGLGLKE